MNVESILRTKGREVISIQDACTLHEAASMMDSHGIGALVVCDNLSRPVGILSDRDIVREIALNGPSGLARSISGATLSAYLTASPDDLIDSVMVRMTDRRVRHMPVMEHGKIAGIISIGDVVKSKIATVEAETEALRSYIRD